MRRCNSFPRDEAGNSAVEFALIVPVLFTLIIGIINICALYFSQTAMDWAAEAGARHWAVNTSLAAGSSSVSGSAAAWAKTAYGGPTLAGFSFNGTAATNGGQCTTGNTAGAPGWVMSATGTFTVSAVFVRVPVTLTSNACFPEIE